MSIVKTSNVSPAYGPDITLGTPGVSVTLAEGAVSNLMDPSLKTDIAILGFKIAANGSLSKYNLVDQTIDDFHDDSGIDIFNSEGIFRDDTDNYYSGQNNNDITLISKATTAVKGAPTRGDIVMTYSNGAGVATINSDITAEFSADDGVSWTSMTLGSEGMASSEHFIATAHNVQLTSTSGTEMRYKISTFNQDATKETRIQAISLGWS